MSRFLTLLLIAAVAWMAWATFAPVAPEGTQVLLFPAGSSSRTIAASLEKSGVIHNRLAFEVLHAAMPGKKLKAGEYSFSRSASAYDVFQRIARGDVLMHTVVVPEGYNMFEIAAAVEAAGLGTREDFLKVAEHDVALLKDVDPQAKSLEGYLFPDTYQFSRPSPRTKLPRAWCAASSMRRRLRDSPAIFTASSPWPRL